MGKQEQNNIIDDGYEFNDTGYKILIIDYYTATYDYDFEYTFIPEYEYEN